VGRALAVKAAAAADVIIAVIGEDVHTCGEVRTATLNKREKRKGKTQMWFEICRGWTGRSSTCRDLSSRCWRPCERPRPTSPSSPLCCTAGR
jgi:hypothetical protein